MRPVVILAPGHGAPTARSLGRLGVPVHGVFQLPGLPASASRYWASTPVWNFREALPGASLDWLLDLGRRLGGEAVLVPNDDPTALFVADHAAVLRERFAVPDQPPGLTRALIDKASLAELCRRHGVSAPDTVVPRSIDDVEAHARGCAWPVMVKGIDGTALERRTGQRMRLATDVDSLRRAYQALAAPGTSDAPGLILQEYIPGGDEGVWMFNGYFDADARCRFAMTGYKVRAYPAYTGMTTLGVCVANADVANVATRFLGELGYRGAVDIDFKLDPRTGRYLLLDVNPRLGMTFRLFVDSAGADVLRVLYRDLVGADHGTSGRSRRNRRWLSEARDVASSVRYARDGRLGLRTWLASLRGVEETAWWARDDPAPFFRMLQHFVGVVARRAVGSLGAHAGRRGSPVTEDLR